MNGWNNINEYIESIKTIICSIVNCFKQNGTVI